MLHHFCLLDSCRTQLHRPTCSSSMSASLQEQEWVPEVWELALELVEWAPASAAVLARALAVVLEQALVAMEGAQALAAELVVELVAELAAAWVLELKGNRHRLGILRSNQ